jgi:nitrile hydratase
MIQPAHVLPDTHAHFLGENPQHVYTVRFDSRELWGADSEPFTVTDELFESYLEPVL